MRFSDNVGRPLEALAGGAFTAATPVALAAILALGTSDVAAQVNEGARPKVSAQATYTGDVAGMLGGADPGLSYLDNLDLTLRVHLEPLVGWKGGEVFLYAVGNQGGGVSRRIGDAQGANNIEAPTNFSFQEAWYEQTFFDKQASLLLGLYDINSEFDHLHSANLFVGSSFGLNAVLGASGENGPSSFPVTSLAARLKVLVLRNLYLQAAVVDGVPGNPGNPLGTHVRIVENEGALVLFESGFMLGTRESTESDELRAHARRRRAGREGVGLYRFKWASGNWLYTAPFDDLRGLSRETPQTNFGGYVSLDGLVWREVSDAAEGLSAHGRFAYGTPRFNAMHVNVQGSLSYTGLFPGRPRDESGLGGSTVWAGRPYRQLLRDQGGSSPTFETAWELTHLFSLSDRFSIQVDAQWIQNPGMNPENGDALLLLSRFQGAF